MSLFARLANRMLTEDDLRPDHITLLKIVIVGARKCGKTAVLTRLLGKTPSRHQMLEGGRRSITIDGHTYELAVVCLPENASASTRAYAFSKCNAVVQVCAGNCDCTAEGTLHKVQEELAQVAMEAPPLALRVLLCNVWDDPEDTVDRAELSLAWTNCRKACLRLNCSFVAMNAKADFGRFGPDVVVQMLRFVAFRKDAELVPPQWETPSLLEMCSVRAKTLADSGVLSRRLISDLPEDVRPLVR